MGRNPFLSEHQGLCLEEGANSATRGALCPHGRPGQLRSCLLAVAPAPETAALGAMQRSHKAGSQEGSPIVEAQSGKETRSGGVLPAAHSEDSGPGCLYLAPLQQPGQQGL